MIRLLASISIAMLTAAMLEIPSFQDGANDNIRDSQWFLKFLDVKHAHSITKGKGSIVAIPDSGVNPHQDFEGNVAAGIDVSRRPSVARQRDQIGHGTQMAGLIAAHGRNGASGALGLAPSAQIIPVKIFGDTDVDTNLHTGIAWAAENGAQIISVSSAAAPSRQLEESLKIAKMKDVIVVAAAGNRPGTIFTRLPAASPDALAVGAINQDGKHSNYSVTGPELDICAPGTEIVTTALDDGYRVMDGTSAAAAIVSGAAALVRARFPELSAPEVAHRLTATATDIGPPGRDDECGFGVLNIVKALTADVPPLTGPGSPAGSTTRSRSPDAGNHERSGLPLGVILTAGAGIAGIGTVVVFFALRRRRAP